MGDCSELPYGQYLLLPQLIDKLSEEEPGKVYAIIPRTLKIDDGFVNVTYRDFANAINRMAGWLEEKVGRSSSFETLAYIGPSDIGYFIMAVAACKIGFKTLLPSPRNSAEGQLNLFNLTQCKALFASKDFSISQELAADNGTPTIYTPTLAEMLAGDEPRKYPFTKRRDEAWTDPFVVLHTSGSTGFPKPVTLRHGWAATLDTLNNLPSRNGYAPLIQAWSSKRILNTLPPFHAAGFAFGLCCSVFLDSHYVWGPSNRIPSAIFVDEMLQALPLDMIMTAPSVLEELVQTPSSRERLEKLKAIAYAGGPLSREAGDKICSKTAVVNCIGSTEICTLPLYFKDPEDWEYFHYNPEHKGVEFRDAGEGLYEQVIVRHSSTDSYHGTWLTFPTSNEYNTNDLYVKHPIKSNLWKYIGRADDLIVLSNGEKLNPTAMEATIRQHPDVENALVIGQARFTPAVILELTASAFKETQSAGAISLLVDNIWPFVASANKTAPAYAQIGKEMIFFSSPEKPLLLTAKGTVRRQATVSLYADEIEDFYKKNDLQAIADFPEIEVHGSLESLEAVLVSIVASVIAIPNLDVNQDFFAAGMDSLHVMKISNQLKSAIQTAPKDEINTRLIYGNPTARMLAAALKSLCAPDGRTSRVNISREMVMMETMERFFKELPEKPATAKNNANLQGEGLNIILTGSTGSLGSYLLDNLLSSPKVAKVYCLNRRANAKDSQTKANISRGLTTNWERVEFLHVDLSKPRLGLEDNVYERLRRDVSAILHTQWQVDFSLVLKSFESHIRGVVNLVKLSTTSPASPPIFFVSSIGTIGQYGANHNGEAVPELAIDDPSSTLDQGYGESKWVAERLLDAARERSGVSAAIWRVGQIAGPSDPSKPGMWNKQEFMPSLIASVPYLGLVPRLPPGHDTLSWIPVDMLSRIMVELVEGDCKNEQPWTKYCNLVNPRTAKWDDFVPVIKEYYSDPVNGKEIQVVSIKDWLQKIKDSANSKDVDVARNPAVKLLDFYQDLTNEGTASALDSKAAQQGSKTMSELGPVKAEWMKLWLDQWHY